MAQHERNAEIWSTRVQRELLALTTSDAPEEDKQRVLPPFITMKEHKLDINAGICLVAFLVEINGVKLSSSAGEGTTAGEGDETQNDTPETKEEGDASGTTTVITITLDASLARNSEGAIDTAKQSYPFEMPKAILTAGTAHFPQGSTIQDGSVLDIDCDWTPSLHLTDAMINIGLKVKESILQKEPFHPKQESSNNAIDHMLSGARRVSSGVSSVVGRSVRGLGQLVEGSKDNVKASQQRKKRTSRKKETRKPVSFGEVKVGDEVNLLEVPWVDAQGVYSCKAVRRPEFVEAAMEHAALETEKPQGTGISGALRSISNLSKSVLEEYFLMITDSHIIEIKTSKLNLSLGCVTFAIPIDLMAKLKFRRQESISLFFKAAPNDPLIYVCPDSGDAVHQIQSVLKRHGVKGKHTNAAAHRAIGEALQLVQHIQTKELALRHDPNVERVNEIMDFYRQAAERFEAAGDVRHEEVVTHMRKFLALPLTSSILDGSYDKEAWASETDATPRASQSNGIPEGEVLERSTMHLEEEDTDLVVEKKSDDQEFEENMESILKEAKEDLESFRADGVGLETAELSAEDVVDDAFADLDAMLNEADKELAELMNS